MQNPVGHLKALIRDIHDFPKPGILFRDITPLLADPSGLALSIELLANPFRGKGIDLVVGAESRGFIFGTAVACCLSAGFSLVRKPGKLPGEVVSLEYELEYRRDRIEIQADAVAPGTRVMVIDDLLATGGTLAAGIRLLRTVGAEVPAAMTLIELTFLEGRKQLDVPFQALLSYDS